MKPVFTMLVGLPGSGKSSLAQEILRRAHDTEDPSSVIWISSDGIRAERYGSESVQGTASEVFSLMGKRTKEALRSGCSVIYDATNIRSRYRRSILMELGRIDCGKVCMIMATPLDVCVERDRKRDRSVGEQIIRRKMYLNWETPYPQEGWDRIELHYAEGARECLGTPEAFVRSVMDFTQDNPWHKETLGVHMSDAYEYLVSRGICEPDSNLAIATLIHDCGKPVTRGNLDSRGRPCETTHYYNHENAGGYNALFFDYSAYGEKTDADILEISQFVTYHMLPFSWKEEKTVERYHRLLGDELQKQILTLHEADDAAKRQ